MNTRNKYSDNQNQQSLKKYKLAALILVTIMLIGILIHSAVFFTINRFIPPSILSYDTPESAAVVDMRLSLREFAETVAGISSTVFLVGSIVILYNFIKSKHVISFRKLFLFFFITIAIMFAFVAPFAIYDKVFWGDYFLPLLNTLGLMILFFLIIIGANLINRRRSK